MLALSLCILFVLFAMPCQAQLEESLADGSSFRSGSLSSSVKWQSSGVFGLGGCQ